jgi:hypothetical protein
MFNTVKKLAYTSVAQISGAHTSQREEKIEIDEVVLMVVDWAVAGGRLGSHRLTARTTPVPHLSTKVPPPPIYSGSCTRWVTACVNSKADKRARGALTTMERDGGRREPMRAAGFGHFGGAERFCIWGEYSPARAALLSVPSNQTAKR